MPETRLIVLIKTSCVLIFGFIAASVDGHALSAAQVISLIDNLR